MKLKDIKDVLTFRSFRPEPDDGAASWQKRFPKDNTLLININKSAVAWAQIDKGDQISDGGAIEGTFKDVSTQLSDEWLMMTSEGWCAISFSTRYVISLEVNLSRRKGSEEQIKTSPKAALGAKAERGKRYAVRHNPESNTSVLLAVDEEMIKSVEKGGGEVGLKIGRVACGTFSLLTDLIDQVGEARRVHAEANPDSDLGTIVMIVCCKGSVCALTQQGDNWTELRSRTDLYEGDSMEPVMGIVLPLIENAGPGAHVVYMSDNVGSELPGLLQARLPNTKISDVTVENQLWKKLSDL